MKKSILTLLATTSICTSVSAFENGVTPLMQAAASNNVGQLKQMLRQGFNVARTDNNGNTAYCYAYENKNYQAAQVLVNYGANPRVRCKTKAGYFTTREVVSPYSLGMAQNRSNAHVARNQDPTIRPAPSSFKLPSAKTLTYTALAVGGVAAAAGGGGGGGGGSSSGTFRPPTSTDVDTSAFETAEFYGDAASVGFSEYLDSEYLDLINAQYAYARGYTGSGKTIAILDSGIDTDHSEFSTNLNADLTNSDQQDSDNDPNHGLNGDHGTNVASAAAADKDGAVIHGVAYDAKIMPYRIGDNTERGITASLTDESINDAISKGADVFNLSYNSDARVDNATTVTKDELEGSYTGFRNFSDSVYTADMNTLISNVTSNEGIIVVAAGNEGQAQSGELSALAYHYNEFDGHMVNVVALNADATAIASYSNRCGITKNYCLAAPGTNIIMADNGGGYIMGDGTSFAAPIVSGAISVVKDAFGLSADRTLNILYATATDMGLPGIDDTYGRGLINLDLATAPGADSLAVSSTGHVAYANTKVSSNGAMRNISLPTFTIEDSLYRTFKVDGSGYQIKEDTQLDLADRSKSFAKTAKLETKKINNKVSATYISSDQQSNDLLESFESLNISSKYKSLDYGFGFTHNPGIDDKQIVTNSSFLDTKSVSHPYLGLAEDGFLAKSSYNIADNWNFETKVFFGNVEADNTQLGKTSSVLTRLAYANDKTSLGLELGLVNEVETLLGSKFEGAFALADNNYTYFSGLTARTALTSKLNLFANAYLGVTKPNSAKSSLISDISTIVSHSANAGLEYNLANDKQIGFAIAQPLKVVSGNMKFDVLTGGNIDQGYQYSKFTEDLSSDAMQLDLQAFYKQQLNDDTNVHFGALHKLNAGGEQGETESSMLVKLKRKF